MDKKGRRMPLPFLYANCLFMIAVNRINGRVVGEK